MALYLIVVDGHEGVARVDPECLGEIEAGSADEALRAFASTSPRICHEHPGGVYRASPFRLQVRAYLKSEDREAVRQIAYDIWASGFGVNPEYDWSQAEILASREENESPSRR